MKKASLQFNLPVTVFREKTKYIAYTPVLDISTVGKSYKEARRRFGELVNIVIEELIKKNTLGEVLRDMGWKEINKNWQPPVIVSHQTETVNVAV